MAAHSSCVRVLLALHRESRFQHKHCQAVHRSHIRAFSQYHQGVSRTSANADCSSSSCSTQKTLANEISSRRHCTEYMANSSTCVLSFGDPSTTSFSNLYMKQIDSTALQSYSRYLDQSSTGLRYHSRKNISYSSVES